MTCEEVLDQALERLRRRGRVTYRALDDAYLADLKAEIIEAQRPPSLPNPSRFAPPGQIRQHRPPPH
jgi:hypothetical protein